MGYFSALAAELADVDNSYPTPRMRLFGRVDDLCSGLEQLSEMRSAYDSCRRLSEGELEYADPWQLTFREAEKALELAKLRLEEMDKEENSPDPAIAEDWSDLMLYEQMKLQLEPREANKLNAA